MFFANAQNDSTVKPITIDLGKNHKYSLNPSEEVSIISKYLPIGTVIVTLIGIWINIRTRRKDDRLKNQLDRLNKQISEFYGPLFTLYETGDQIFISI